MGLQFLPYQPIIFESLPDYGLKIGYDPGDKLPVDTLDLTKFQFRSVLDQAVNVLLSPSFTPPRDQTYLTGVNDYVYQVWIGGSWQEGFEYMEYQGGGGDLTHLMPIHPGAYQIKIVVRSITSGSMLVGLPGQQEEIKETGVHYIYVNAVYDYITVSPVNLGEFSSIDSIELIPMPNNYRIGIYDLDNNYQDEVTDIVLSKDSVTITTEWSNKNVTHGCYKYGIVDEYNEIVNGDPELKGNGSDYTLSNGAIIAQDPFIPDGGLWVDGSIGRSFIEIYRVTGLKDNTTYIVEYTGATIDSFSVQIFSGSNTGQEEQRDLFHVQEEITTDGTYIGIQVRSYQGFRDSWANIRAFTIKEKGSASTGKVEAYSNELDYNDWADDTVRMNWANNDDAFGFVYEGSAFTPVIRLRAKLSKPSYPNENERFRKSNGVVNTLYFEPRKMYDLIIAPYPEFVHDALSLIQGHDSFYIEDEGFKVTEGDYEPDWEDEGDYIASAVMEVETQPALEPKIRCSTAPNKDVSFPPSYLLLESGDYILLESGDKILLEDQF